MIKKGKEAKALKVLETILQLIRKRQKLIKLADKSDAGCLALQEYEQEELVDTSVMKRGSQKFRRKLQEEAKRQFHQ